MSNPGWYFNEMDLVGVDYKNHEEVMIYDKEMSKVRDIYQEIETIKNALDIQEYQTLLEIGSGTGTLAIEMAKLCKKVYAVDISQSMIDYSKRKSESKGVKNIQFSVGGFLSYKHESEPVDYIVSQLALHHLPDMWKLIALSKIREFLKPGGKLFIKDIVFSFDFDHFEQYESFFNKWVSKVEQLGGRKLASETEIHIRDEYSTTGWIMEGLLRQAGYLIDEISYQKGKLATYVCTRFD